jgi:hypothetical protein
MKSFDFFDSSSSFRAISNGIMYDYTTAIKLNADLFKLLKSQTFTKKFEDIKVLDKDHVLWIYQADVMLTAKKDSSFTLKDYAEEGLF